MVPKLMENSRTVISTRSNKLNNTVVCYSTKMAGSMFAMPLILLNMGGEMVYILQQRLHAQSVEDGKARKVLLDVARAMFSPQFVSELFKPQEMYTFASTKQIFEKLAHSSIMRLNKSSMDKLFDLMSMGFKKQVISCHAPHQMIHTTIVHLESLKTIVRDPAMTEHIQSCEDKFVKVFASLSNGQWMLLQQSLLCFLQGRKIKVSLFLQQGVQGVDGAFCLDLKGKLPHGTEVPGKIRMFEGNTMARCIDFNSPVAAVPCFEDWEVFDMQSQQGLNVYMKDVDFATSSETKSASHHGSTQPFSQAPAFALASKLFLARLAPPPSGGTPGVRRPSMDSPGVIIRPPQPEVTKSTASAELNMLADLLGLGACAKDDDDKPFKISLFPDDGYSSADSKSSGSRNDFIILDIDGTVGAKSVARYMEDLGLSDDWGDPRGRSHRQRDDKASDSKSAGRDRGDRKEDWVLNDEDDEDDLLALMDASAK